MLANPAQFVTRLIPDEQAGIEATLIELADIERCSLILTTGGTGPAPRDVTPEATLAVAHKVLPGFGEQMRAVSLKYVPTAILSRQVGVTRGASLILNLPGQPKAIKETLDGIFAAVPYCIDLIGGPYLEARAGHDRRVPPEIRAAAARMTVLDALARALRDLFNLRVLWVVVWPMLVALLLWLVLGVTFWGTFSGWIAQGLDAIGIQTWLAELEPAWIAHGIQALLHLMLFVPLVMLTALVITALFGMPALIRVVAGRDYPELRRENGGGLVGSLWNAVVAIALFAALWLVTLPLWLIGVGVIVPFVAAAYLNQRLFRYDAIAEHASAEEMAALFRSERNWLVGTGPADRAAAVRPPAQPAGAGVRRAGLHPLRPGAAQPAAPFSG